MKIALCLSGQPRYLEDGYKNIHKNLLSKYDIDVFCHYWWDTSYVGKKFDFSPHASSRTGFWKENTQNIISELYHPILSYYEPQKQFDVSHLSGAFFAQQSPHILYSMWYSIFYANLLKTQYEVENNFIYDIVIRCRFDIIFNTFTLDLYSLDTNKIHISGEINPICNDQFAISSSEHINYYSTLYNNIDRYWIEDKPQMVNEHILTHHLIHKGKKSIEYHTDNSLLVNIIKS
jgi:hypothetical protein